MIKETRIDYLLRSVSSCDTEAGERLRYHLTRSLCSREYARSLSFASRKWLRSSWLKVIEGAPPKLASLFIFVHSPEGHDYWYRIHTLVELNQERT